MNTALVIDESPRWRETIAALLRAQGWTVLAATGLPDPEAASGCGLAVLAAAPGDSAALLAFLHGVGDAPLRCVLLANRPAAEIDAALQRHPRVVAVVEKSAFSAAALLPHVTMPAAGAPAPSHGPKVLVVEDDVNWRAIYEELLADAGYTATCAVSYGEARAWLQRVAFDLAIVDLNLASSAAPQGNRDGLLLLRAARQRGLPALVVSALGDPADIDHAYDEYGIFAFVEKEGFDRRNFLHLLEEARRARAGGARPPESSPEPSPLEPLTPRERDVLALLVQGHTNRQIAEALLISPNTTKKHVDHILQKLGVSTRAAAVAAALRADRSTH
jgi:DNA-binding NarL/FixJ family response regulator